MAELILRPVSDSTLAHSCSSGSSGWALINEATADDDTGYIYQSISGTSSSSQTSVFRVSGAASNKIRISSLNLSIRGRTTKGKDADTATLAYNVYFNGVEGSSGSGTLSTSYGNFSKTYNASDFGLANTIFDGFDAANIVVHVLTTGAKSAKKNDDFQNRVTQVYLTATYEEVVDPTYACSAVAGEGIQSASVSASPVIGGESCTFTAALKSNYDIFDGWYSDSGYANLVSTANPYTTAITADTTLYTKASRSSHTMTVGEAEHGTASVSSATAMYGDSVTYTFTPEDETWELYGWYSDSGLTSLVSEANPYTFTATNDVTLYPKVGLKRYTITLQSPGAYISQSATDIAIIAVKTELLTVDDMRSLRAGNFAAINSEKIIAQESKSGAIYADFSVSIVATVGSTVALYAKDTGNNSGSTQYNTTYFLKDNVQISNGPYYVYQPVADDTYTTVKANNTSKPRRCDCIAIALDGVDYAEVYPKEVAQGLTTTYTADMLPGYSFQGWYSDEACTTLVSSKNPYSATAPTYTTESASATSLTLYAKAQKTTYEVRVYSASAKCEMTLNNSTSNSAKLYYGDTATVSCSVKSSLYEFGGWYSDDELTQLVSTDATYSFTVTESIYLYAKTQVVGDYHTITIGRPFYDASVEEADGSVHGLYAFYLMILRSDYYAVLSSTQKYLLDSGDVPGFASSIEKGWDSPLFAERYSPVTNALFYYDTTAAHFVDFQCPTGCIALIWAFPFYDSGEPKSEDIDSGTDGHSTLIYKDGVRVSNGNCYYFTPTSDATITSRSYPIQSFGRVSSMALVSGTEENPSTSSAISWCDPSEYPKLVYTGSTETFSAQLADGYSFEGWYTKDSDGNYALCSIDNPFTTTVTFGTGNHDYVLYSKIVPDGGGSESGIYLKQSGAYVQATAAYKKVDGAWVADIDYCKSLLSQKDRKGTIVKMV